MGLGSSTSQLCYYNYKEFTVFSDKYLSAREEVRVRYILLFQLNLERVYQ